MSSNTSAPTEPARIQKLDESVINRIAAGEIINRPSNALKELIENSLDAGATSISINVKDGGLKLLQIQDNGHGIRTEDLHLVCERFTTSKLKIYEDLSTIQTYGFRGEALASISHVSHLSITTKKADSECAYRASYSDGKLVPAKPGGSSDPEPCAGNNGTIISAEDLFYNIPSRKNALKNTRDEYNRIVDVASRYAIHNSKVAFSCRKMGAPKADLVTQQGASTLANIRQVFGGKVASSLTEIAYENKDLDFSFAGQISSATHEMHKAVFLLFINHRLVDHTPIKRAIESLYSSVLPKASKPFVYLDLRIKPENVDVNVHPTKREVRFLNEDSITGAIVDCMHEKLVSTNDSRTFAVQSSIGQDVSKIGLVHSTSTLSSVSCIDAASSDILLKTPMLSSTPGTPLSKNGGMDDISSSMTSPTVGRLRGLSGSTLNRSGSSLLNFVSSSAPKTPTNRAVRTDYKTLSLDSFSFGASPSIRRSSNRVQSTIDSDFSVTPTKSTPQQQQQQQQRMPLKDSPSKMNVSPTKHAASLSIAAGDSMSELLDNQSPSHRPAPIVLEGESLENVEPPLANISPRAASTMTATATGSVTARTLKDPNGQSPLAAGPPEAATDAVGSRSFVATEKEPRVEVRLTSILGLRKDLQRHAHPELTQILGEHSFVGFVDDRKALIQHQTRLYMFDYCKVSYHLFRHRILFDFMNFGRIAIHPPPAISELALVAARELSGTASAEQVAGQISQRFMDNREMLEEYFHIGINDDGCVETLPMLVRDYSPDYDKLPLFLYSAALEVNWDDEVSFFRTFSNVLATYYALEPPLASDSQNAKDEYRMVVEHRLMPALKGSSFWAPEALLAENALVQLVDVPDLYRIFERC
ncbi:DNA mismatch repair protein [Coemansia sp. Benny D115]|nr:DNA mismatch repair protein [Coemansia sp. Benny D115]